MKKKEPTIHRTTKETDIRLTLDFSNPVSLTINTGVPFFNHLLQAMAFHGNFGLNIDATGDIQVDPHHLVEDTGIVLGEALHKTLEESGPVARFGYAVIPMDDSLSEVAVDISERPCLVFNPAFPQPFSGNFDMALLVEFLSALVNRARITLHATCRYGKNSHHMAESLFKALGKAIAAAYTPVKNRPQAMSTKGSL
ncbi:MAG: imidazoleglycerol-phosphate dehydratase HisB [Spirochaetota bacterium]